MAVVALATAGFFLPIGTLDGDAGRLLMTFLGLIAASILPTVSLMLGSMTSNARSVKSVNELKDELSAGIQALFGLFAAIGIAAFALMTLAIPMPNKEALPLIVVDQFLPRMGQAVVVAAAGMCVMRLWIVPAIIQRALQIRHEIAVDEARRKTSEKAPSVGDARKMFPTDPGFGKAVNLSDLNRPPN